MSNAEKAFTTNITNLDQLATKDDRACVVNILGGESRGVTPTSHVYSGGNVVCGTALGKGGGALKTKAGDIPVYNTISEAAAQHDFNVVVIYVPPAGVREAVIEAIEAAPKLNKVIILTEKVSMRDARLIRALSRRHRVDVFGANCLGLGDAHNHVRLGGALGGSAPEESLVPGSVAIHSNSGNFTTTIATYLLTQGWGTTTSVSSGKDVYIHYALAEFADAFHADDRSKSAVVYAEPGGYYEQDVEFKKPVVACIVGRWKDKLTRACGHAGAIAGEGDSAVAKERWFMRKFGVDGIYTPENPVCSAKGAVVTNIAYIPEAMTAVMEKAGGKPDFAPRGDLSLKCWIQNTLDMKLPANLDIPVVEALEPYDQQIAALDHQIGAVLPRENLKDASGASQMDPKTQVTSLHGTSILDCATRRFEENIVMSLVREYPGRDGREFANVVLNGYVPLSGKPALAAADAAREAGNSPNTVLAAALAVLGPREVARAADAAEHLVDLFAHTGLRKAPGKGFDVTEQLDKANASVLLGDKPCRRAGLMLAGLDARKVDSVFVRFLAALAEKSGRHLDGQALLAAAACHLAWGPLMKKRVSLATVRNLPWHIRVIAGAVGTSVPGAEQTKSTFRGVPVAELAESWSFTETAYLAQIGARPRETELADFSILLGLVSTNGPGTITAQGAKGAVSADGPQNPARVQINKAYLGMLTHAGYAHGGNGYEAMAFLLDQFRDSGLADPGSAAHKLDLAEMALAEARDYKAYKKKAKEAGDLAYRKIPCVSHPVFKGKDVNTDPREAFVRDLFRKKHTTNVFLDYYHHLVEALFKVGVSKNVYCVNIDAVIATILLKMLWKPFTDGEIDEASLERSAFTVFLYARLIGTAAEVEDHINRGRDMDTRTAASKCRYVG